jgi:uncharacterized membrane protein YdjX (TVP38/TMEM64 family)
VALVVVAFVVGSAVREQIGVELSAESIRSAVQGLGLLAPVLFVGVVIFRNFLLLPSAIVLIAGGLVFGAGAGTLLGGAGIVISALMKFTVARVVGREWIRPHLGSRVLDFERRIETAGPLIVGLTTAHPMGVMSPFHWGAGLSTIAWIPFLVTILLAGPVRAFVYAYFGAALPEPGSHQFYIGGGVLLAVALLPLAHPGVRRRLFARRS